MTSDEPLPDRCAAQCRDGGYCTQYPVGDGERCRMHGGTSKSGEENGNYKHGAYSKYLRQDLTDDEADALEEMSEAFTDPEEATKLVREQAAEAYVKYKRSGDERFLREYRQLVDTFNLAPNEQRFEGELNVDADVTAKTELTEQQRDVLDQMTGADE